MNTAGCAAEAGAAAEAGEADPAASAAAPTVVTVGPSGIDHYYEADVWPAHGDKAMLNGHALHYGGMTANGACVLAALSARVRHVERLPENEREGALASLREHGVDTGLIQLSPTAGITVAYVIRVGGERTILIDVGEREPLVVNDEIRRALREADAISAGPAELRHPELREAVFAAVDAGVPLAVDVESCGLDHLELDLETVRRATWICAGRAALAALGLGEEDFSAEQELLLTAGAEGSTIVHRGERVRVPAVRVEAVDTTGCSDTYFASYLFGRLTGASPLASGTLASRAAARAATGMGPRYGAAPLAEIEAFRGPDEAPS